MADRYLNATTTKMLIRIIVGMTEAGTAIFANFEAGHCGLSQGTVSTY